MRYLALKVLTVIKENTALLAKCMIVNFICFVNENANISIAFQLFVNTQIMHVSHW